MVNELSLFPKESRWGIQHTSRTGKTYYLHIGTRKTGQLRRHATAWQYIAEVKKDTITVHECATDLDGLDQMALSFSLRSPLSNEQKSRFRHYVAVLRFILGDKESRTFVTERFCFRGSVNRWIHLDGPAPLPNQQKKYIKHLEYESMYNLF